jgi:hypothetical protein
MRVFVWTRWSEPDRVQVDTFGGGYSRFSPCRRMIFSKLA